MAVTLGTWWQALTWPQAVVIVAVLAFVGWVVWVTKTYE